MNDKIAVLLTCFNRKDKTLGCLDNLFSIDIPKQIKELDVYLVDDGSTDGTFEAVKDKFSQVTVIKGTGNLFWNQGMRLAWDIASHKNYFFYLWLNDDVILNKFALVELFECYQEALLKYDNQALITGAFKNTEHEDVFSYGGRSEFGAVIPNGNIQKCKYINGNAVLVSREVFSILGNLSVDYTHAMGDFDYGLRALNAGFVNITTKQYIGVCPVNESPKWANSDLPLRKRLELFNSPTGLNYKEYIVFRKKFWGIKWVLFAIKAYIKVLVPSLYKKLKK